MSLQKNILNFITESMGNVDGKKMLLIGDQIIAGSRANHKLEDLGAEVVQIDFDSDISELGDFEIIVNFGRSGRAKDQASFFGAVDQMCVEDGIMLHVVAETGSGWAGKQYDAEFFSQLSYEYLYELNTNETIAGTHGLLRIAALRKKVHD